ncbi:hypothetical protein JX265_010530 [Neoarthrinium moseri]|uniref:Cytochrome P450 n=1 Tax=Neoarthrinium moseri TaxID=1658444 RepID=A0A9P9WDU0_9PEZI|nr:hypothetical protein JX265_010530 [Neoarthrinium moseri]
MALLLAEHILPLSIIALSYGFSLTIRRHLSAISKDHFWPSSLIFDDLRIGPNIVSLSDPDLLKTVYSTRGEFLKSEHFAVADGQHSGRPVSTIFSARSNAFHAQTTQPIAKLYSLPSILKIESLTDQSLVNLYRGLFDRCIELIMERVGDSGTSRERTDMLDIFLQAKETYPDVVEDSDIMAAGSDTSASLEKAVIYHVLKDPAILAKLQAEPDAAYLSFTPKYSEVEALPYLDATIKEGLRIHPPIGVLLERIVPRSGLKLRDGRVIPAGTIVGMNAWVLIRNKEIFGDDDDVFRPERWLQVEGESARTYKERVGMMKEASFSWGGGNRVCIGKNMATVSIYKVIATIFRNYNLEPTDRQRNGSCINIG